jgi:uncharacterized protein
MRNATPLKFILMIVVLICIEVFAYQTFMDWSKQLKTPYKSIFTYTYITLSIGFWVMLFAFPAVRNINSYPSLKAFLLLLIMAFVFAKVAIALVASLDYLKRFIAYLISFYFAKTVTPEPIVNAMSRNSFIRNIAVAAGGTLFGVVLYGASNRYNYTTRHIKVPLPNLPNALGKLKIVQISDVHSGSFTSKNAVQKGINQILALQPDLIFFTGDLVNNIASEMHDYIDIFSQLKAPLGVYSTLGNHDYGDYYSWANEQDKLKNLNELKTIHAQLGWQLLLNENKILTIDGEQLAIIGVENISASRGFHTYGNLQTAYAGTEEVKHKILLSHDPSHWNTEVKNKYNDIQLTLSGHTHGMQFGIEIPGWIKWSPVKYVYEQWAGLYKENDCFINVNRGFGFLGYPGRIGIMPEITMIQFENKLA